MTDLLRLYLDPEEIGPDGYPHAWHGYDSAYRGDMNRIVAIKDIVRQLAGDRCVRCGHPYRSGQHGNGEWSPCDERCTHGGPTRLDYDDYPGTGGARSWPEAQWRILTVHHLNGIKHDCRWWNLAALCQRCHLSVQTRVIMERAYDKQHSEWFKPYAAGWYAWRYLGEDLTREQTMPRLGELLALEHRQDALFT